MEDNAEKNASQKETSITKNECLLNEIYNESNDAGSLSRINSIMQFYNSPSSERRGKFTFAMPSRERDS